VSRRANTDKIGDCTERRQELEELDAQGLLCPEPLMLVRHKIREMSVGEVLHITATDPSTDRDFANFCRFLGHELERSKLEGPVLEFWIKKA
jgi:tRNA 2-thiouridine synthesizing protein A